MSRQIKIIVCCKQELPCPDFTNTCPTCNADYNWAGQRLAPREDWGWETGEHWTECLISDPHVFDRS